MTGPEHDGRRDGRHDGRRGDEHGEALRRVLDAEAAAVLPGDGLAAIRSRTGAPASRRWLLPVAAGLATLALAGGTALVTGLLGPDEPVTALPETSTSPTTAGTETTTTSATSSRTSPPTSPTTAPTTPTTAVPAGGTALPVYYLGTQPTEQGLDEFRLFREYHLVAMADPADRGARVALALGEMLAGTPDDPDYSTPWPSGAVVRAASVDTGAALVTVDLAGLDWAGLESADGRPVAEIGESVVQQLVFTATAAASMTGGGDTFSARDVRLLVDGQPVDEVLGVDTSGLLRRDPVGNQAAIWVTAVTTAGSTVTVEVLANLFEGGPAQYKVRQAGELVREGVTGTGAGQTWAPYVVEIDDLPPGTYEIEVFDVGGLGLRSAAPFDTKTFTIG